MLNWLLRALGLGPTETTGNTAQTRPIAPSFSGVFPNHAPAASELERFDHTPVGLSASEPASVELPASEPPIVEPSPAEAAPAGTADHEHVVPEPIHNEPVAPPASLQFAAFVVHSSAGGRVFGRPEDGRLVHEPGNAAPDGREVHGFVTDSHPGILFVVAADGPTGISVAGGQSVAQAFRIEESGDDAFALLDLANGAYLCAPQHEPGVNALENDRGVVNAWEMFHLLAAEGVSLPAVLPPLLPPAGTPITASSLEAWRSPPREG